MKADILDTVNDLKGLKEQENIAPASSSAYLSGEMDLVFFISYRLKCFRNTRAKQNWH
jgi:hypothetical protein